MSLVIQIRKRSQNLENYQPNKLSWTFRKILKDQVVRINQNLLILEVEKQLFANISTAQITEILILIVTSFIEKDPIYDELATGLLHQKILREVFSQKIKANDFAETYRQILANNLRKMEEENIIDSRLLDFDLKKLSQVLVLERDNLFNYLGLETLYSRYFLRKGKQILEIPQTFWMRVAMGLALNEKKKDQKAIEFYQLMSSLRFVPSTPTLFHSGLKRAQLSSCFLSTTNDDLDHIFKTYRDTARLLKYSGGVATDWSNLRAIGAPIKSINTETSGMISFLKGAEVATHMINRSGRRRGATAAYLEVWHLEIEDFLDLRRNVGDERRRTHGLNLAAWIPDLFMKRVKEKGNWTLFSPSDTSDLHHIYGQKFAERYLYYEQEFQAGKIKLAKQIKAFELWKKILTRLFETGYPWITFKDSCNIRSPQDHCGVVHSSNLCTEITLNTSEKETAVCNLGSVNLARHLKKENKPIQTEIAEAEKPLPQIKLNLLKQNDENTEKKTQIVKLELEEKLLASKKRLQIDDNLLQETITLAIRMLDNVIDLNSELFADLCPEAEYANSRHRPIGLGMMGFQDALFQLDINYNSSAALKFTDELTEKFSYYALAASCQLAEERGTYASYPGSKWDRGIFPLDTLDLLEKERGLTIKTNRQSKLNWKKLKEQVKKSGLRNSNTMAIAPTASIANIAGCYPCIEAMYSNIYVKSNVAGEFTVVNKYLVADLKKLGLWNQSILDQIKYYEGSIQKLSIIPQNLKEKYRGVFEIDPLWMIEIAAVRSKWIDQSISHNVFAEGTSGKKLNDIYFAAWEKGLKTTYYLRTLGASQIEKSTLDASKFGYNTQKRTNIAVESPTCSLREDCESCQ